MEEGRGGEANGIDPVHDSTMATDEGSVGLYSLVSLGGRAGA
jgi:hypothetical protein